MKCTTVISIFFSIISAHCPFPNHQILPALINKRQGSSANGSSTLRETFRPKSGPLLKPSKKLQYQARNFRWEGHFLASTVICSAQKVLHRVRVVLFPPGVRRNIFIQMPVIEHEFYCHLLAATRSSSERMDVRRTSSSSYKRGETMWTTLLLDSQKDG